MEFVIQHRDCNTKIEAMIQTLPKP